MLPETANPHPLPSGDHKDYVQKELDQIQSIISRMAANSFQCKGWAIGIVTIVLAINRDSLLLAGWQSLLLLLPVLVFWYLDGFFLYTEQCYRYLFNDLVKKRFEKGDYTNLFDYNYTRYEHEDVRFKGFWLGHVPVFIVNFLKRKAYWLIGKSKQAPKSIPTIPGIMFSKTLNPFYLLPVVFIFFAAYKSNQPAHKTVPDPVVIKVDSSSLAPVLRLLEQRGGEVKRDSIK